MSKAKFQVARELIQAKQYDEARAILKTIDHPMATEWIAKIDLLDPPVPNEQPKVSRPFSSWLLVPLLAIGGLALVYFVWTKMYDQGKFDPPVPAYLSSQEWKTTAFLCTYKLSDVDVRIIQGDAEKAFLNDDFFHAGASFAYLLSETGDTSCTEEHAFQVIWQTPGVVSTGVDKGSAWHDFRMGFNLIRSAPSGEATGEAKKIPRRTR